MKLAEPLYISEDLEQGLIAGVIHGVVSLDSVPTTALSKNGKAVVAGIEFLQASGSKAPFAVGGVLTAACDVAGAEKGILEPYLIRATKATWGKEAAAIAQKLCEQTALSELANEISRQMAAREFDPAEITKKLAVRDHNDLIPACNMLVNDELPPIPTGYPIRSLPRLTEASGGVMGVWAIGGKKKMGKSTLGVQIALDMPVPVLYYDLENGKEVLMYRMGQALGGKQKFKTRTTQFYIRRNAKTLDADLKKIKAPAVIVIDSIQKLPTKADNRRTGIDAWLAKFERLKEDGYTTILISEVNGFDGFKESSEIEYTVDFGMQLRKQDGIVVAHIVANRHRLEEGDFCAMERVHGWSFKESEDLGTDCSEEEGL